MNKLLVVHLLNSCNLNCKYCYEAVKTNFLQKGINRANKYEYYIEEINKNQCIDKIVLTGGEVSFFPNLEKLILNIDNKPIEILTNGILKLNVDKNILKELCITVSLDGNYNIMKLHRNIKFCDYTNIINNILWYKIYAKSLSINTLITKHNLNEESIFLYNLFGEDVNYSLSTPSEIFTPDQFKLDYNDILILDQNIKKAYEKYNYRIKCNFDIINKRAFKLNSYEIVNRLIIIELYCDLDYYYVFNKPFKTLCKANEYATKLVDSLISIFNEFLKDKDDDFLFNPYSFIERIMFEEDYEILQF